MQQQQNTKAVSPRKVQRVDVVPTAPLPPSHASADAPRTPAKRTAVVPLEDGDVCTTTSMSKFTTRCVGQ